MQKTTLFIKNMVCARCIGAVKRLIADAGLQPEHVALGEATLSDAPDAAQWKRLRESLEKEGFEMLDDRNSRLVEQIKNLIVAEVHHDAGKKPEYMNFSDFLARETGHSYTHLSKLFSSVEGMTIEKYLIAQRIERVKELLVYDERSLSEIAWEMGYSSTQHLSNQFRQATGMSPTQFKTTLGARGRRSIDEA